MKDAQSQLRNNKLSNPFTEDFIITELIRNSTGAESDPVHNPQKLLPLKSNFHVYGPSYPL